MDELKMKKLLGNFFISKVSWCLEQYCAILAPWREKVMWIIIYWTGAASFFTTPILPSRHFEENWMTHIRQDSFCTLGTLVVVYLLFFICLIIGCVKNRFYVQVNTFSVKPEFTCLQKRRAMVQTRCTSVNAFYLGENWRLCVFGVCGVVQI